MACLREPQAVQAVQAGQPAKNLHSLTLVQNSPSIYSKMVKNTRLILFLQKDKLPAFIMRLVDNPVLRHLAVGAVVDHIIFKRIE